MVLEKDDLIFCKPWTLMNSDYYLFVQMVWPKNFSQNTFRLRLWQHKTRVSPTRVFQFYKTVNRF